MFCLQVTARLFLMLWIALAPVEAWAGSMTLLGVGSGTVAAPYIGPVDIIGAPTGVYTLRAASAAKAGTKAINLCDNTGANCADISTNATTGRLNNPGTLGANNCATSATCLIKIWYDQSGGTACGGVACDASQATVANMATLNFSCVNGLPCAVYSGAQFYSTTATLAAISTVTYSAVANRNGAFTAAGMIVSLGSGGGNVANLNFRQVASAVQMFAGTAGVFISNVTDSSFHAFQAVFNGASSVLFCGGSAGTSCSVAGVSNSINPGVPAIGASVPICLGVSPTSSACNVANSPLTGQISEVLIYGSVVFSGAQQTNMTANQYNFWGPF